MHSPLLTVCMLTYNHEEFIAEALDSVLSQCVENFVLIVADDHSQDNTVNILQQYKEKNGSKIILIANETNLGIPQSTENIYKYIPENTKYISWFSGDDVMLPGKLSQQVTFLENNPKCVMCYHDTIVRDDKKKADYRFNNIWCGEKAYSGNIAGLLIKNGCFISALSIMVNYKNTRHIKHNVALSMYNDWAYFIELSIEGKVGYINQVLGIYRRHMGNVTKNHLDNQGPVTILKYLRQKYSGFNKEISIGLIRHYLAFAWKYFLTKKFSMSLKYFKKALKYTCSDICFIYPFIMFNIKFILKRIVLFFKTGSLFR